MPTRVFAFFLACLMLWCGLSTIELPAVAAAPVAVAANDAAELGSVADHHLDDQPAQTPADPGADPQVLPASAHRERAALPTTVAWPQRAELLAPPPWLAGLLRPPCQGALAA